MASIMHGNPHNTSLTVSLTNLDQGIFYTKHLEVVSVVSIAEDECQASGMAAPTI